MLLHVQGMFHSRWVPLLLPRKERLRLLMAQEVVPTDIIARWRLDDGVKVTGDIFTLFQSVRVGQDSHTVTSFL